MFCLFPMFVLFRQYSLVGRPRISGSAERSFTKLPSLGSFDSILPGTETKVTMAPVRTISE